MKRIIRLLCLSRADRSLFIKSWGLLGLIRLGLCLFPFQTLRAWLVPRARRRCILSVDEQPSYLSRVTWAVRVASRYLPGAPTCLVQALATQALLARRGLPARLLIGLTQGADGHFEGHAWVESDGRIVMGKGGHERYVPLTSLGDRLYEHSQ